MKRITTTFTKRFSFFRENKLGRGLALCEEFVDTFLGTKTSKGDEIEVTLTFKDWKEKGFRVVKFDNIYNNSAPYAFIKGSKEGFVLIDDERDFVEQNDLIGKKAYMRIKRLN